MDNLRETKNELLKESNFFCKRIEQISVSLKPEGFEFGAFLVHKNEAADDDSKLPTILKRKRSSSRIR